MKNLICIEYKIKFHYLRYVEKYFQIVNLLVKVFLKRHCYCLKLINFFIN